MNVLAHSRDPSRRMHSRMSQLLETLFRILPWLMTNISANMIHYQSLLHAREEADRQLMETAAVASVTTRRKSPGNSPEEHEMLTSDLMQSPLLRKVRCKVIVVHYVITLSYLSVFYHFLPELQWHRFDTGFGCVEAVAVGLLIGLVTVLLDENRFWDMKSAWRPGVDLDSRFLGYFWDGIRISGVLITPLENCLFYHSWMYRILVQYLREEDDVQVASFTNVSFMNWSWKAWITCNAAFALCSGKQWKSSLLSGLLSLWVMGRSGQFLDGILALVVSRMTVNAWDEFTRRQL